jgi:glycosyltransferase involved in cell wall biosynthesis
MLNDIIPAPMNLPTRCLSVVIPVYNEAATFKTLISKVAESPVVKEILIVDDFSTDGTRDILRNDANGTAPLLSGHPDIGLKIFFQDKNQGKGAAIRRGFANATAPYLIVQDADLEYDPAEYQKLLAPLLEGKTDVVYGSRFLDKAKSRSKAWHTWGNQLLTSVSNIFTGLKLTDMETCYKVFKTEDIQSLRLESNRFGFEPEVTAKIAQRKWRVVEVPISYQGRGFDEGKKIGWKDGVSAIYTIVKYAIIS